MLIRVQRAAHPVDSSEGLCCFTGSIIQHERPIAHPKLKQDGKATESKAGTNKTAQ